MTDKVTIVSVVPFQIGPEVKPHVYPGEFTIPEAPENGIAVLVVGPSFANRYIGNDETIKDYQPARKMAESVVFDYKRSKVGYKMDERGNEIMPGLFIVDGEHTPESIEKAFPKELESARRMQKLWFRELVQIADDSWAREHQHKLITDEMRYAARALNLTREWDIDVLEANDLIACAFCTTKIPMNAIKCPNCHEIVNQKAYDARKAATVPVPAAK